MKRLQHGDTITTAPAQSLCSIACERGSGVSARGADRLISCLPWNYFRPGSSQVLHNGGSRFTPCSLCGSKADRGSNPFLKIGKRHLKPKSLTQVFKIKNVCAARYLINVPCPLLIQQYSTTKQCYSQSIAELKEITSALGFIVKVEQSTLDVPQFG